MTEVDSPNPEPSTPIADGNAARSMEKMEGPGKEQPSLPPLSTNVAPASRQDAPRTTSDDSELRKRVDDVLQSDVGVSTLLNRLRQSIASAKDFSTFLKERSIIEERHANGLRKLCRGTLELVRRPESRQGSFGQKYGELITIQDRVADNGTHFAMSLHQMSDDLYEMSANAEKGRKHWKHAGLSSEQRYQDAETASGKAKTKYDALAEQYDRARTGDRQAGRFGLKTKSAAQQEEDLSRKVQAADAEYASRVQAAQASRRDLINTLRPQAVRALTELISECDSAVALQLQKFASLNERLILGNGLCISPLKAQPNGTTSEARSQREVINGINNEKDFRDHILSFSSTAGSQNPEIKYEKHPALLPSKQNQPPFQQSQHSFGSPANAQLNQDSLPAGGPGTFDKGHRSSPSGGPGAFEKGHHSSPSGQFSGIAPHQAHQYPRDGSPMYTQQGQYPGGPEASSHGPPPQYHGGQIPQIPPHSPINMHDTKLDRAGESSADSTANVGVPDRTAPGFPRLDSRSHSTSQSQPMHGGHLPHSEGPFRPSATVGHQRPSEGPSMDLPPLRPVFGVALDELFRRDGMAVPSIVHQCTVAIEAYGLDTEGIYRVSGSHPVMMELQAMFDHDFTRVDLHNPALFHHDISAITTLLKQFLRSLPDPLLTSANYASLLSAAQIDDDIVRRDSLHAIINDLPDANYATLRHLAIHFHRVANHAQQNHMNPSNLAIVLGPTLMRQGPMQQQQQPPPSHSGEFRDARWQVRTVETIILNTFQIFDDEE